ncbi:hypothetical protein V0288_03680 [Pannus brasiliensis CCIBt3594]|uniref:Glycosyltransferase n=1 Tax=Pannus brasiliensis CCIBt3594 TaxID=1427578 RepID=A0AAW9QTI9_9CHRO
MSSDRKPIRVLHCPCGIGGNPQGLARAERQLGLASHAIVFELNEFQYDTDEVLLESSKNRLELELKRWRFLARVIKDFDIIHFNFGRSIMPQDFVLDNSSNARKYARWVGILYHKYARFLELIDLPLLKKSGKGIVFTYQGDDARQGDYCLQNFEISIAREVEPGYYSADSDRMKRKRIAKVDRHADRIFTLNPDLGYVLPSRTRFLPYSHIDLDDWRVVRQPNLDRKPVVLHAPSHQGAKGTRHVLNAIDRLREEGIDFEFMLVEGLPNAEARRLYEKADILIDQLLAGWYGGLAVELMALGKPVICYIREEDLRFIPPSMAVDLPIIRATPITLYEILKRCLTLDRVRLTEWGNQSRAYVEKWHDPRKIASWLKHEYELILAERRGLSDRSML